MQALPIRVRSALRLVVVATGIALAAGTPANAGSLQSLFQQLPQQLQQSRQQTPRLLQTQSQQAACTKICVAYQSGACTTYPCARQCVRYATVCG